MPLTSKQEEAALLYVLAFVFDSDAADDEIPEALENAGIKSIISFANLQREDLDGLRVRDGPNGMKPISFGTRIQIADFLGYVMHRERTDPIGDTWLSITPEQFDHYQTTCPIEHRQAWHEVSCDEDDHAVKCQDGGDELVSDGTVLSYIVAPSSGEEDATEEEAEEAEKEDLAKEAEAEEEEAQEEGAQEEETEEEDEEEEEKEAEEEAAEEEEAEKQGAEEEEAVTEGEVMENTAASTLSDTALLTLIEECALDFSEAVREFEELCTSAAVSDETPAEDASPKTSALLNALSPWHVDQATFPDINAAAVTTPTNNAREFVITRAKFFDLVESHKIFDPGG